MLDALLSAGIDNADALRAQAARAVVVGGCSCGCPSVDFEPYRGIGMTIRVNAVVPGTDEQLFLYTIVDPRRGELLGGIEWFTVGDTVAPELPAPELLDITPA
ncbi:hypothetical protein [Catenuloplanes niger]|uniref:hypothetical protein n=1 Tax=Catenuloplanes niger TaxID=587534 RepID=UPI00286CD921|nr:hypothetical protein [Catenuloplanes niger]